MDAGRWERIQILFHDVADLPSDEQRARLRAACGGDQELLSEVLALLEEDTRGASVLDRGLASAAAEVLGRAVSPATAPPDFGPYRVRGLLGEGGMGVVYLAERADLGSLVAIKILRDAWLSPARRERFASEQRTLAQLTHPSIARLYDADTLADGTPYFVMEYVEGRSLTEYCRVHALSIERQLALFRSVCDAVQYAHRHAVLHRDLKPSNILVKDDGEVRLLDFGIAKPLEGIEASSDRTRTGLRPMTPAYAAPEQARGGRLGIYTDVYSLGVILYELLTGRLPFDLSDRTPGEAATILVEQEPEKPSAAAARGTGGEGAGSPGPRPGRSSWKDLDVLCLTAMHKDVARRYRSVEALARDVDHYLNREPLEARPDSRSYRLGKFVRRNRSALSVTALVLLVVVGLVVFFTARLARARNAALAEAARTQRIQRFMIGLFEGGDEDAGPAEDLRVVSLLDRGAQDARALDADPAVQAELYQTLGSIYEQLGKLDRADALLTSALATRRAVYGADSAEAAESLVALGLLRADQARLDEAERAVREGLDMTRRRLPPNHPAVGRATAALGRVLNNRGAHDRAIAVLQEAVQRQSAPGETTHDLAESLTELANAHYYAGHYEVADTLNRQVLEMDRRLYGERHPHVASDLINLGAVQFTLGRLDEAERLDRQALEITEAWYGQDHPETASARTILGRALVREGRFDEAVVLLRSALAVQERTYGQVHPRVASALNELGTVALRSGRLDEAEASFGRMAAIYRTVYGDGHSLTGTALSNLASVAGQRKDYARAARLLRDAVACFAATLSADHLDVGIVRIKLGDVLLHQGAYAEAERELLEGHGILLKQSSPPAGFLKTAREDLVAVYEALHRPERAATFRAELAGTTDRAPASPARAGAR